MASRRRRGNVGAVARVVALLVALALAVSAGRALAAPPGIHRCQANALSATFTVIPGSAGGGLVAYRLKLRNSSTTPCRLGFARVRLLDRYGRLLSTTLVADPNSAYGSSVVLEPGQAGAQVAHFSATFPGQGEPTSGPCEPTAYRLRVVVGQPAKGAVARIEPPTPVCSSGMLMLGAVSPAP